MSQFIQATQVFVGFGIVLLAELTFFGICAFAVPHVDDD